MTNEEMENALFGDYIPSDRAASQWVWFMSILVQSARTIVDIIGTLEDESLASTVHRSSGTISQIPDNQWQIDVMHWWATWLASIQTGVVNTAYGPTDAIYSPFRVEPFNQHVRQFCNSQVCGTMPFSIRRLLVTPNALCSTNINTRP
jgi:hypothetical protein